MKTEFDALAKRFLSDLNLSFQFVDFNHFLYCINTFGYRKKWNKLLKVITERYDGNPTKFLDEYYKIRDNIIMSVLDNNDYQFFKYYLTKLMIKVIISLDLSRRNIYGK